MPPTGQPDERPCAHRLRRRTQGRRKHGPAIKPGAAEESPIFQYVSGIVEPRMPMGGEPLPDSDIARLRAWIAEGAVDDTPAEARAPQAPKTPPLYTQPPVITGMSFSPDGKWLAVGGYREVLLHNADGSAVAARLLGRSEKISAVAFSKDSKRLVAVGGAPAKFGEVQVWDVDKRELERSILVGADTLFGGALSPDAKRVVVGLPDKTVRVLDLETGKEVVRAGYHEDWVLDAAFGIDGQRIVTVGRDRAAKLADASTGAFLENVNLLRDMLYAVKRHPRRDQVLIGGEDRVPYLYLMDRPRALKIADDQTLVREYPEQQGRIHALAFSPDGGRIAVGGMSPEVTIYDTETAALIAKCKTGPGVFVLSFSPDGKRLAAAGFDGEVRLFDAPTGELAEEFSSTPLETVAKR
ncbi:MAG: WD40 repeat domain-containing protein [Bryobacterales bacterium]